MGHNKYALQTHQPHGKAAQVDVKHLLGPVGYLALTQ